MIRKRVAAVEGLAERFDYVATANPGAPLGDVRVRAVDGFENYLLYYRPIRGGIEWLAIRHAAQGEMGDGEVE